MRSNALDDLRSDDTDANICLRSSFLLTTVVSLSAGEIRGLPRRVGPGSVAVIEHQPVSGAIIIPWMSTNAQLSDRGGVRRV